VETPTAKEQNHAVTVLTNSLLPQAQLRKVWFDDRVCFFLVEGLFRAALCRFYRSCIFRMEWITDGS
jgi:hypothetical protein